MTETNNIPAGDDRHPHLMTEELAIVGYFARGQKQSSSSQNLKLEATDTSIRLSDRSGRLIGISKQVNQWQRKVLVSNSYSDRATIVRALSDLGFITRQKSSHPEFTEYHHYQVPDGYKLNYTEVIELWKVWWNHKRYQLTNPHPPIDVLTFSKGNWCLVEDLQPKQGNFILRTLKGEIKIEPEEYVVWIDSRASSIIDRTDDRRSMFPSRSSLPPQQHPAANSLSPLGPSSRVASERRSSVPPSPPLESSSVARIDRDPTTPRERDFQLPVVDEDLDLESYLNTFNTEDTEDVDRIEGIYHIGELLNSSDDNSPPLPHPANVPPQLAPVAPVAPPTSPPSVAPAATERPLLSLAQRQESLKLKAIQVLMTYLQEGDRIVRTEVLKNAIGQEIHRKIVKTERGCPSWAIEQVLQMTSADS
jgi:hypothetical protein